MRRVERSLRQGSVQLQFHTLAAIFQLRPQQLHSFDHHLVQGGHLNLRLRRANGLEELSNDVVESATLSFGDLKIVLDLPKSLLVVRSVRRRLSSGLAGEPAPGRRHVSLLQYFQFTLDQLQVDVQRIQRITNFMGDARRQQCQGLDPLALNRFKSFLSRFRSVMQDERETRAAGPFAIQRRRIQAQKTGTRISNLKFVSDYFLTAGGVHLRKLLPIQSRQRAGNRLAFADRTEQFHHRLVEINDPAGLIHDEHAIFNGIEKSFQETALPSEALHHRL